MSSARPQNDGFEQSNLLTARPEHAPMMSPSELSDRYFNVRRRVLDSDQTSGDELLAIQDKVERWLIADSRLGLDQPFTVEDYAVPSEKNVMGKFEALVDFLQKEYPDEVTEDEITASRLFVESSFALYDKTADEEMKSKTELPFAFIVPLRLSRSSTEYGPEVETIMPILRFVPNKLRAAFAVGLPPCILDKYNSEQDGKEGYLVLAPIFTDMMEDLDLGSALEVARDKVNDTVDFAYNKLGAEVQGLGAIIPALTRYGKTIDNPNVVTTTGHAGTINLIFEVLNQALLEKVINPEQLRRIGVIGLGSIGQSIAEITREHFPDAEITVFDAYNEGERTKKVALSIGAVAATSVAELLDRSEVIISAVTSPIDLDSIDIGAGSLEGKLIIDDSQPCSFDAGQVEDHGGVVAWVIGQNGIKRDTYDYGGSMAGETSEVFGCEAEAAVLAHRYRDLIAEGIPADDAKAEISRIALRRRVTPDDVNTFAKLFKDHGVQAAPLQVFGTYIN